LVDPVHAVDERGGDGDVDLGLGDDLGHGVVWGIEDGDAELVLDLQT